MQLTFTGSDFKSVEQILAHIHPPSKSAPQSWRNLQRGMWGEGRRGSPIGSNSSGTCQPVSGSIGLLMTRTAERQEVPRCWHVALLLDCNHDTTAGTSYIHGIGWRCLGSPHPSLQNNWRCKGLKGHVERKHAGSKYMRLSYLEHQGVPVFWGKEKTLGNQSVPLGLCISLGW